MNSVPNSRPDTRKTSLEMVEVTFNHLNSFKRYRAKANHKRNERNVTSENFNLLKAYESIDALELALRGLQSLERSK